MTRAELRAEVFRRLRESSAAPVFFSVTDVNTALDDAYAEISDATEWYERSLTVDLLNARPWYDARTVLGSDFLALGPAFNADTQRWLIPTSVRECDAADRRWEVATGEPQRVLGVGLWWFGYWPRVTADAGTVTQYYTALPPTFVDDTDTPGFPETWHDALVDFALTDLWAQDGETARALAAWTLYLSAEAQLTAWVQGRGSDPRMRGYGTNPGLPA